jgi:wyosine [tRNA(Phe)-imidazoG37] synthetase (radical SAM superfamily)
MRSVTLSRVAIERLVPRRFRRYYRFMHSSPSLEKSYDVAEHRRGREAGRLVYPVVSRRSGGLSLGINLFPDAKDCSFDCPYCEVFPIAPGMEAFSIAELRAELELFVRQGYAEDWAPRPVRDLCFSGNGEPTSSPFLSEALELCSSFRRLYPELLGSSSIVVITNSTGFLDRSTSELLERYSRDEGLAVWAKLDGGSEELFRLMSGSSLELGRMESGIADFARRSPVVVQTMLCEVDGRKASETELEAYAAILGRITRSGGRIAEVHLYTFARPCPSGRCAALSDAELEVAASMVASRTGLKVRAFDSRGELQIPCAPRGELEIPCAPRGELQIPGAAR